MLSSLVPPQQFDKRLRLGCKLFDNGLGKQRKIHNLAKAGPSNEEAYAGLYQYMQMKGANEAIQRIRLVKIRNRHNKPTRKYYWQRSLFSMYFSGLLEMM